MDKPKERTLRAQGGFGRSGGNAAIVADGQGGARDIPCPGAPRAARQGHRAISDKPMPDTTERLLLLISERRIRARIATLARRIDADYRGRTLCLVVVLKGAFVFAADLARQLATPSTTDFIRAASYGAGTRSSGKVALGGTDALQLDGRHVRDIYIVFSMLRGLF
jgi:Phosphoribosyl transferase domain